MRRLIYIIIIHLISIGVFAQTYTPFGTPIDGFYRGEESSSDLALWEHEADAWVNAHGNGQVIKTGNATATYNCHSFAWNMSEGGNTMWINMFTILDGLIFNEKDPNTTLPGPTNITRYWTDGSYIEVPEYQATKVWFGSCWTWSHTLKKWVNQCDHSAIRLPSGLYESKWGPWGRYIHPRDKCPYNLSSRRYFKVNLPISGPPAPCNEGSYTIGNFNRLPSGFTVQWGTNNSNLTLVSGQGTDIAVYRKVRNGADMIECKIVYSNRTINLNPLNVYFGAPAIQWIAGPQSPPNGQEAGYEAILPHGAPIPTNYEWILNPQGRNSVYPSGRFVYIAFYDAGTYQLVCRATNNCGVGDYSVITLNVTNN